MSASQDARQVLLETALRDRTRELDTLAAEWLEARTAGLNPDPVAERIEEATRNYRRVERKLRKVRA